MKNVDKKDLYQRLKKQAFNSSHYVWLWSDLSFIQTDSGWIFAITKKIGIHLIALEPLPPLGQKIDEADFESAFKELREYLGQGTIAFVAIYTPFAKKLTPLHFQSFQIGKEPWADLSDIKPTGHAGRKIRVAINQSTKAGLRVEEWKLVEVLKDENRLTQLNDLKKIWEEQSLIALSGFLHGMTFDSIPEDRRCFVALTNENKIDGVLIVTPIESGKTWYFEDTIIRMSSSSNRGVGELLTIGAMEVLQNDGFKEVSLGIVPMTTVGVSDFDQGPPSTLLKLTNGFQNIMGLFYNASGLELFRRRFKLNRWDKIFLSVQVEEKNKSRATLEWIKVFLAIGLAYKPALQLKASFVIEKLKGPIKRYSFSFFFIAISLLYFSIANYSSDDLNLWLMENSLFSLTSPLWQWPARTMASTFFYFSNLSFGVMLVAIGGTLLYIEKEVYDRKWTMYAILAALCNDAVIRTLYGLSNQIIPDPTQTNQLLNYFPTSGGSILLATLLGFSITFVGQKKEKLLAYGIFSFLFASIFASFMHTAACKVLLNMIFFTEGYLLGRVYTYFQSKKDQIASKNKKPTNDNL